MKTKDAIIDTLENMEISMQHIEASLIVIEGFKGIHYTDKARDICNQLNTWIGEEKNNLTIKDRFLNKAKNLLAECKKT